jgi:hypothetical protein
LSMKHGRRGHRSSVRIRGMCPHPTMARPRPAAHRVECVFPYEHDPTTHERPVRSMNSSAERH